MDLPGRVWTAAPSRWIGRCHPGSQLFTRSIALPMGLRGAFAFPIPGGTTVLGVIECFSRSDRRLDDKLVQALTTVGIRSGGHRTHPSGKRPKPGRTRGSMLKTPSTRSSHGPYRTDRGAQSRAERTFGYRRDQAIGRSLAELLAPAERARHRAGLARYLERPDDLARQRWR